MRGDKDRKYIVENGLKPDIRELDGKRYWSGQHAIEPNGDVAILAGGLGTYMRRMVREGYWPECVGVVRNVGKYYQAREKSEGER